MVAVNKAHFNLAWWNVGNFYHFNPERVGLSRSRWPQSQSEYNAKLDATVAAIGELKAVAGVPDIFFLCEISSTALSALGDRAFPGYRKISLDVKKDAPTLQVGILYNPRLQNVAFKEQPPIVVPGTPQGTRPMAVLDVVTSSFTIRIVGCHWQSRFDESGSDRVRFRLADSLAKYAYDFLNEAVGTNHLIVVGDLNEEPFEHNLETMYAHRHRDRSRAKVHHTDHHVQRAHLYNTSWRLLGEKHPHPASGAGTSFENCAGTFYWESERTWHHFDHVIVSGGLLRADVPYLDESELHVVSSPKFLTDGVPLKFHLDKGRYLGLSDHLPIAAKIYI